MIKSLYILPLILLAQCAYTPQETTLRSYRGIKMQIPSHLKIEQTLSASGREDLEITKPKVAKIRFTQTLWGKDHLSGKEMYLELVKGLREKGYVSSEENWKSDNLGYSNINLYMGMERVQQGVMSVGVIETKAGKKMTYTATYFEEAGLEAWTKFNAEEWQYILKSIKD